MKQIGNPFRSHPLPRPRNPVNFSDDTDLWVTLLAVSTNKIISDGGRSFSGITSRQPPAQFQLMAATLVKAHERGLTTLCQVVKDPSGDVLEVVFERVLTESGVSFLNYPGPKVKLSDKSRALLRSCLEGTPLASAGPSGHQGIHAPERKKLANYTPAEQLRDSFRDQSEPAPENQGASRWLSATASK